jgi:serine/threonine protein kinase
VVTPFTRSKLGAADAQGPSSDVGREAEATSRAPILIEGYCNECKQGLWGLHIDAPCLTGRDVPFTPAPPRPSSFGSSGYTIRSYDDSDSQDDSDTLLDEPGPLPTVFHHKHDIKYTFQFRLGEGATGRVMLAHAVYPGDSEEHQVAIKVFSKGHTIDRGRQALTLWNMESNEQRRKLMISMIPRSDVINSETNLLKGFYDAEHQSPFLTSLLAAFQDEKNVYLVMVC